MQDTKQNPSLDLSPINSSNWRKVVRLKVKPSQSDYVADAAYYLLLCHYGELWQPLAITLDTQVIGFIMWAIDQDDGSCWVGGFHIDADWQGKGYGRQAIQTLFKTIIQQHGINHFALSVQPENPAVKFYQSLGFTKTEEWEDDEMVLRLSL